jgi:hypothetical protein
VKPQAKAKHKTAKPSKTPKVNAEAQRKLNEEAKLWSKLQNDHLYTIGFLPKNMDKTGLMFNFNTGESRKVRIVRLTVPADSALGKMLAEHDKPQEPKKGRR